MKWVVVISFLLVGILLVAGYPGRAIQVVNYSYFLYVALAIRKVSYDKTK